MKLCEHCARGAFHGYPPAGAPEWDVGTVCFWCEARGTHGMTVKCPLHLEGTPKRYDKHGNELEEQNGR